MKARTRSLVVLMVLLALVLLVWWRHYRRHALRYVPELGISVPRNYPVLGIDLSRYQDPVRWKQLKTLQAAGTGITFVFVKATEGISRQDASFRENWRGAAAAGLTKGAYHFFYATRDPLLQARNFEKTVLLRAGDLVPVLDLEVSNGLADSIIRKQALIWLKEISRHYGVIPIVYTNWSFYRQYLGHALRNYPLWISNYLGSDPPRTRPPWSFWQVSNQARIQDIPIRVDFDVFRGDSSELKPFLLGGRFRDAGP